MHIKILTSFILGYVNIQIDGFFIERFINTCVYKGVFLWNMQRERATILKCNVSIKNFRKVAKIAKQTQCKFKITNKKGLPFIFNKYRKRKIFAIAFMVVIVTLIYISNFVWNIEIIGTEKINNQEIIEILKNDGLDIGKYKNKINKQEIINKIRLERADIAWVGIEIKGTNAIVKIVEAEEKPEIINKDEYCNIIAKKAGTIVKISAQNGVPAVSEGEEVNVNDILINGWIEGKYTGIRYLHAEGEVLAKIKYSNKLKVYYNQTKTNQNENKETKYSIKFNNFQINFYKTLSKFKNYDTIKADSKIKILNDYYLPISIIKSQNFELEEQQIIYTQEEAKNIGIQENKKILEEQVGVNANIIEEYVNTNENEEYIEVEVVYEVLESIGAKEKIVF